MRPLLTIFPRHFSIIDRALVGGITVILIYFYLYVYKHMQAHTHEHTCAQCTHWHMHAYFLRRKLLKHTSIICKFIGKGVHF